MKLPRFLYGAIFGLASLATGAAATTGSVSGPAAEKPAERYPLEFYLTGLAERHWENRAAELAKIGTAAQVEARRDYIRTEFLRAIGGLPEGRTPLNARITGVLERPGYRVEKLIYESQPGNFVTANLYIPTTGQGPFPAVLGTAGHATKEGKASPVYQTAFISLALRGHVVLAYDPPGQGERFEYRDPQTGEVRSIGHFSPGLQCLLTGGTSARYFVWDGIRGLDYLLTRPEVDPRRIATAGNSGGGTQSAYLGVLEPRLAAVASSCYWTSWEDLWRLRDPQDSEQVLPRFIERGLDFSDLTLAFAPKPILMLTATRDAFPVQGARVMFAEARPLFALVGAEEQLGYFEYDDGHAWSQPRREATVAWFDRWLYGRSDFVKEPAITPEPWETLRSTETGHVLAELGSKTMQRLNQDLAEKLYPQRTLRNAPHAAQARTVVANRLAMPATRPGPASSILERVDRSGYTHETVALRPEAGIELKLQVILPTDAGRNARPALIVCRELNQPIDPETDPELVSWRKAGHVVIVAPLRGLLSQPDPKPAYTLYYKLAMRALLVGRTMVGMRVQDLLAVHAYATTRPEIDAKKVSVLGRGNQGVVALYAAALEPAIQQAIVEGGLVSYMNLVSAPICPETLADVIVPGALLDFDLPDLANLAGKGRVVLVNPVTSAGQPAGRDAAQSLYGDYAKVLLTESSLNPGLLH